MHGVPGIPKGKVAQIDPPLHNAHTPPDPSRSSNAERRKVMSTCTVHGDNTQKICAFILLNRSFKGKLKFEYALYMYINT